MRKKYEKPIVELVAFEMSDAIAGCNVIVEPYTQSDENACEKDPMVTFRSDCEVPPEYSDKYCYYTAENSIFTS